MKIDLGLQDAETMRRRALERQDARTGEERRKVAAMIRDASAKGALSLTYYEPISEALSRELSEMGYQVTARSHPGLNATEWNVTISWEKPHGRGDSYPVNSMQRD